MTTTLYFRDGYSDTVNTTSRPNLRGGLVAWFPEPLTLGRGDGYNVAGTNSVAGPTPGVEAGSPSEFVTLPLAADVTISGAITANLWAWESGMAANAAINFIVQKVSAVDGSLTTIVQSARTTELPYSAAAAVTFGATPGTGVLCHRGDRLRAVVYFDDAGTMGSGYSLYFDIDAESYGVDGDSWLNFTEDIRFIALDPGAAPSSGPGPSGGASFGAVTQTERQAQQFYVNGDVTVTSLDVSMWKSGSPNDNVVVAIQADSGGLPSGTDIVTFSKPASEIAQSQTTYTLDITDTPLSEGFYWLIFRRSGTLSDINNYLAGTVGYEPSHGRKMRYDDGSWYDRTDTDLPLYFAFTATSQTTTVYLTGTSAGINPGAANELEAWTSRGSGSTNSITNTASGPTSGIQLTDTGGGTTLEWYTKQLEAFTLGGKAKVNVRAKESAASAGASLRCEIAVCDSDGSNPVVWGVGFIQPGAGVAYGELLTSEFAYVMYAAGDDVAVTDGQRLRFRVYVDDAVDSNLVTGYTVTMTYAGTTAGAAGDTYVIFPQTLNEYATSPNADVTLATVAATAAVLAPSPSGTAAMTLSVVNALANVLAPSASGSAAVTLNTVACVAAVYSPTVAAVQNPNVQLSTVPIVVAVQAPAVVGNANAPPNVVAVVAAVNAPTVQAAAATTLPLVAAVAAVLAPQTQANAAKTLDPVAALAAIPTPTVDTTTAQDADVQLSTVAVSVAIPLPTVFAETSADVTLSLVAITVAVPSPTIEATASLTLTTVAGVTAVLSPTIVSTAAVTLTTVAIATTIPTPTADASIAITLGVVSVVSAISTLTVTADANLTLSPVLTLTAVLAPSISAQQSPSVDLTTVQIVVAIPTPAVSTPGADVTVTFLDEPTNLVADGVSSSEMALTWDTVTGASSYIIERDGVVVASGVTTQPYPDTGLDAGTQYRYRVRGVP